MSCKFSKWKACWYCHLFSVICIKHVLTVCCLTKIITFLENKLELVTRRASSCRKNLFTILSSSHCKPEKEGVKTWRWCSSMCLVVVLSAYAVRIGHTYLLSPLALATTEHLGCVTHRGKHCTSTHLVLIEGPIKYIILFPLQKEIIVNYMQYFWMWLIIFKSNSQPGLYSLMGGGPYKILLRFVQ